MENIIEKEINKINTGDILGEDIVGFNDLKKGVRLTKERLSKLLKMGLKKIKVIESISSETVSKKESLEKQIRDNIELAYLKNIMRKKPEVVVKDKDYAPEVRKQAKEIITHIKQSHNDIIRIENLKKKALKSINKRIESKINDLTGILKNIIENKVLNIKELEDIVKLLIEDTGPKRDSTFLLLHIKRNSQNYIIRHSINVALLSMAIAIELSKIMENKLNNPDVRGDFKKLEICNRKIFNEKELIKLGTAALLHDLGLIANFPNITEDTQFGLKDKSKIEMHPNEAYHLLTSLGIDFDIRKAILQHHERIDGSGYPDGIKDRFFTKYGLVLSFADYFEQLTSKNPFVKYMHPHRAIMHILTKERSSFDADVLYAYCQAASLYPIGSWVILSNGKIGVVMRSNKDNLKKPIIKVVLSADMKELLKKEFVDLTRSNLRIMELVDIESLKMLDETVDRFMFDEREFERAKVTLDAEATIAETDIHHKGLIKDIGAGGIRFESDKKLIIGDELFFKFNLNGYKFENVKGLIVWSEPKNNLFEYGVRFLGIGEDDKQKIMKFVESNK